MKQAVGHAAPVQQSGSTQNVRKHSTACCRVASACSALLLVSSCSLMECGPRQIWIAFSHIDTEQGKDLAQALVNGDLDVAHFPI